jgi:hypothetical protein
LIAGALLLAPAVLHGQEAARWLPGLRPFEPLIAAPRETQFRGSFVLADRADGLDYAGRNLEAEVVIGHSVAILRMDDGTTPERAVTLGFELGIFSRFYMESAQKDLINVDYRVGLPIAIRHDAWQVRITLRHISSHIGDDYVTRFPHRVVQIGDEILQRTKDGVEGLVARSFGSGVRVYGGGDFNFHVNDGVSRTTLRTGLELNPQGQGTHNRTWPFAAVNVEYPSLSDRWGTTVVAGMGAMVNGRTLRMEARAHFGSSPMGQLGEAEETIFGVGIAMIP